MYFFLYVLLTDAVNEWIKFITHDEGKLAFDLSTQSYLQPK